MPSTKARHDEYRGQESDSLSALFRSTRNSKPLTSEREHELAAIIQSSPKDEHGVPVSQDAIDAAHELVYANVKFAYKMAMNFGKGRAWRRSLDDLVSCAITGMIIAAYRFRPNGNRFISYAVWYVKQAMQRDDERFSGPVTYPSHCLVASSGLFNALSKAGHSTTDLAHFTDDELTDLSGVRRSHVRAIRAFRMGVVRLTSATNYKSDETGLDSNTYERIDRICYPDQEMPDQAAMDRDIEKKLEIVLGKISPRHAYVLRRLFMDSDEPTMEEVGRELGVCRERVRQIRNQGIAEARWRAAKMKDVL